MSFTTQIVRTSLLSGASEVESTFQLQVGNKVTKKGDIKPVYSTLKVKGHALSDDDSLALLAALPLITWNMPKGEDNAARIFRTPSMSGIRAVIALCLFSRYSLPTSIRDKTEIIKENVAVLSATWDKKCFDAVSASMRDYLPTNAGNAGNAGNVDINGRKELLDSLTGATGEPVGAA